MPAVAGGTLNLANYAPRRRRDFYVTAEAGDGAVLTDQGRFGVDAAGWVEHRPANRR